METIIRFVELQRGITYCYSGAKTLDIVENILPGLEHHPSVHTIIVHVGTNDTKLRRSIKLQEDLELLAISLGKHCFFRSVVSMALTSGCRILTPFWLDLISSGEITYTLTVGGHASLKQGSLPTLGVYQLTDYPRRLPLSLPLRPTFQ